MTEKITWEEGIGYFLLLHWIVLLFDRAVHDQLYNMFWVSHLALLLVVIGFLAGSTLILTGALISVVIVHGLWIYDLIALMFTGVAPLNYVTYVQTLPLFRKVLTIHHIYLLPLLFAWLWDKRFDAKGWLVATGLFLFSTLISFIALPYEYNINCAHEICPLSLQLFPFLSFAATYGPIGRLIVTNLSMAAGFLLINVALLQFTKISKKKTRIS